MGRKPSKDKPPKVVDTNNRLMGPAIEAAIKRRGITRPDAAKLLGVSESHLGNFIRGEYRMSKEFRESAVELLGVNPRDLDLQERDQKLDEDICILALELLRSEYTSPELREKAANVLEKIKLR